MSLIEIRNLCKKYKDNVVLDGINMSIQKGDVIGIIGRNGAGKSTLLKLLSRVTTPTTGVIRARGRIASLLEVGTGFHPEMTGRENIYLNGAILGYTKEFLDEKYPGIVEFSGIEDFIDVPLRNYSSGMIARLAFSIATVVQPEILIVDEVLSVGDADFRQKSLNRMMELMSGGTTVLYVSHDLKSIREMCTRVVWLDHGEVKMFGDTQAVCDAYEAM
jgi:ABC-2 type transport system ATP-binding protein/lipopolysaccharide transport system ATP-binding protein